MGGFQYMRNVRISDTGYDKTKLAQHCWAWTGLNLAILFCNTWGCMQVAGPVSPSQTDNWLFIKDSHVKIYFCPQNHIDIQGQLVLKK